MFNWYIKEKPFLSLLGMGGGGTGLALSGSVSPLDASGGTKYTPGNGYIYHVFQYPNSDTFTVNSGAGEINYLLVGGGGAGGMGKSDTGGGGGGGQALSLTAASFGPGTYPITVGRGGIPFACPPEGGNNLPVTAGTPGEDTTFNGDKAGGGGLGATHWSQYLTPPASNIAGQNGRPGTPGGSGSGGGGGVYPSTGTAGTGSLPGGYPGGGGPIGGSGGGAGGAGSPGPANYPSGAPGGPGAPFPIYPGPLFTSMPAPWQSAVGPTGLFGGGGGSAGHDVNPGSGGPGGGGNGAPRPDSAGSPGVNGTGGGGGGGGKDQEDPQGNQPGGGGGHGICIIRYLAG